MKLEKIINLEELDQNSVNFEFNGSVKQMKQKYDAIRVGDLIKFKITFNTDSSNKLVIGKYGNQLTTLSRYSENYEYFDYEKKGIGYSAKKMKRTGSKDDQVVYKRKFRFNFDEKKREYNVYEHSSDFEACFFKDKNFRKYNQMLEEAGI